MAFWPRRIAFGIISIHIMTSETKNRRKKALEKAAKVIRKVTSNSGFVHPEKFHPCAFI